jgi:hypothetical protein
MMVNARQSVLIKVPVVLKRALIAEAARRGASVNDVIVGAVAGHYGVDFKPSGRRSRCPHPENKVVVVRMSPKLKRTLQLDAVGRSNLTDTILRILVRALEVDLQLPVPSRTTPFGGGPPKRT